LAKPREILQPFRPRARVLQLLGDELISSPRLAVFELVKNAYDADAGKVVVQLDLRSGETPSITVKDDGEGMNLETIQNIWLVPGDDHRQRQRHALKRTTKHNRLPLGEKGLGRFAVHKLGDRIRYAETNYDALVGADALIVVTDWNEYRHPDFARIKASLKRPVIVDGRNLYSTTKMAELGFKYYSIGRTANG